MYLFIQTAIDDKTLSNRHIFPKPPHHVFAYSSVETFPVAGGPPYDGWRVYDACAEYARLGRLVLAERVFYQLRKTIAFLMRPRTCRYTRHECAADGHQRRLSAVRHIPASIGRAARHH